MLQTSLSLPGYNFTELLLHLGKQSDTDTHTRTPPTGRIEVSAQNHNYAVNPESLPKNVEVTHINLNDGTCAGLLSKDLKLLGIQYHPEASPGPHDGDVSFQRFIELMRAEGERRPGATSATGLPMIGV